MKPGLAVLPLEVWTDVFVFPWITRQELARIVDKFKDRKFAEKLQFRLHDMGKLTLRYLTIEKEECNSRASLLVSSHHHTGSGYSQSPRERCEFPETEMPQNIRGFKRLTIRHLDDQVLDFLGKIKPLFANVFLDLGSLQSEPDMQKVFGLSEADMRTLLGHLLPMIASIRRITCYNYNHCVEFLERQLPGTLALAKELNLLYADTTSIPAYLDWLCAPQGFEQSGPRFSASSKSNFEIITVIVEAVRKQFLAATTRATFVIFIDHNWTEQHSRVEEFTIENAITKEKLTVRNGKAKWPELHGYGSNLHYVKIMRNPMGADARMQEWIEERAYYQQEHKNQYYGTLTEQQQPMICVGPWLTIGQITKQADGMDQAWWRRWFCCCCCCCCCLEDKRDGNAAAGPSSSSAKKTSCVIS